MTVTLPKLRLELLAESAPGAAPVPDRAMLSAVPDALLVIETVPLALPAAEGLNITLNEALLPAEIVSGKVRPLRLKPEPLAVAWVTVTSEPPELVKVSDSVLLEPVCTEPKLRLELLAESVPGAVAVPESGTVSEALDALLVTVRLPVGLPAEVGLNTTLNETLLPASTVAGSVRPLTLKPAPKAVAWLIVTLLPPELVNVCANVLLDPVSTEPKLRLEGLGVKAPAVTPEPDRVQVSAEPELGVIVAVPEALPADAGAKVTLKVVLWPAASVRGVVMPLSVKPVPVTAA